MISLRCYNALNKRDIVTAHNYFIMFSEVRGIIYIVLRRNDKITDYRRNETRECSPENRSTSLLVVRVSSFHFVRLFRTNVGLGNPSPATRTTDGFYRRKYALNSDLMLCFFRFVFALFILEIPTKP